MTAATVGGGVASALTRLLRPEEDPVLRALDAWPLTVPDLLGESGPAERLPSAQGGGLTSALDRLLRPDREVVLLAIYPMGGSGRVPGRADAA